MSLLRELEGSASGSHLVHWPRGVDAERLQPRGTGATRSTSCRGRSGSTSGRVAVEKSLEDFLALPLPGTKVVVGDGPSREELQRRFPDVVWRGYRFGDDLAAHFASADCFVFPSRTETFGNVLLEAMASGLPVASVPAPGPVDLVQEGRQRRDRRQPAGRVPARAALLARASARASIANRTLDAGHEVFRAHLVPVQPQTPS